ncbi:hypothetical protein YWY31_12920 [Paenibacillus illinoisensis]
MTTARERLEPYLGFLLERTAAVPQWFHLESMGETIPVLREILGWAALPGCHPGIMEETVQSGLLRNLYKYD